MLIKNADKKDLDKILEIAKELKDWFNETAIQNMKNDFIINNTLVAVDKEPIAFICYSSFEGAIKILWLGTKKQYQGKGIGTKLINDLENKAKKLGIKYLQVETLTDKESYEPYKLTRDFYYKKGFKKICEIKAIKPGWDDQILLEKQIL